MSENKRYFWIKLPTIYFNNLSQKKMRKQDNGLLLQVIYLKLMLLSCNTNGVIYYQWVYDTIAEEIAEEINEQPQEVEKALAYFEKNNLLEYQEHDAILPQAVDLIGSETQVAERVRKHRLKTKALQCNIDVTNSNTEKEKDIEKDIDIEIDKNKEPLKQESNKVGGGYGTHQNINLTDAEYNNLCESYSKQITDSIINKMSAWIKEHNKPNYATTTTIKEWINKNYTTKQIQDAIASSDLYDLQEIEKQALKK